MREHLIRQFLNELGRELEVEGLELKKRAAILAEAQNHLFEAFEAASPADENAAQLVISQFGTARSMGRSLAREDARARSRRRYLWPALVAGIAIALGPVLTSWRVGLFGREIWFGTLYLFCCSVLLFILGYRARRPLLGQFLALGAVMLLVRTCWFMATCYPIANTNYTQFVDRNGVAQHVADMGKMIGQEHLLVSELQFGRQFFSNPVERPAPSFLRSRDGYKLADGVRETAYGLRERTGSILTASTWADAVKEWNRRPYDMTNEGIPGRKTSAEVWILRAPQRIADLQNNLNGLYRSMREPWRVRLRWTLQLDAPGLILMIATALISTNMGWLLWLLLAPLGRQIRRIRLSLG